MAVPYPASDSPIAMQQKSEALCLFLPIMFLGSLASYSQSNGQAAALGVKGVSMSILKTARLAEFVRVFSVSGKCLQAISALATRPGQWT